MQFMSVITQTVPTIDLLIKSKDYVGAIQVLDTVDGALHGDLNSIVALR